MKLTDLLKQLSEKAGIAADSPELLSFIAANQNVEIPDTIGQSFTANLMNEQEAALHAPVKNKLVYEAYSGIDKNILEYANERGFDDLTKAEIAAEKKTVEKIKLLEKKSRELESKKYEGAKGKEVALVQEIEKLKSEILASGEATKKQLADKDSQAENTILQYARRASLASKNFANKQISKDINVQIADALIEQALNEKGVKVVRDTTTNQIRLYRKDDTNLPYSENHKEVTWDNFTDGILSTNKLLDVGNSTQNNSRTGATVNQQRQTNGQQVSYPEIDAHYAKTIAEFSPNGHGN